MQPDSITEDKPEQCARVASSGVGINLKTSTPTPDQVRHAVRLVLSDPQYRQKARQLKAELRRHDAPNEASVLLERLIETRQPVLEPLCMEQRDIGAGAPVVACSQC